MKRTLAALAAGAIAALATASPAFAASGDRAHWTLDEPGSPPVAYDTSGNGNNGTNYDITGTGSGYVFNGTSSRVVVPDANSLDPGTSDFSFQVTLSMTAPPAVGETFDVLRKGLSWTPGGDYKIEVKNVKGSARARCLVKDVTKREVSIIYAKNLADGKQHTVTCTKTSTGVSIKVDNLSPKKKTVTALGSVSNASNLALGAKAESTAKTGFDWFKGTLYDARVW